MGLDIRWPIGLMFTLIGTILVVYGLVSPSTTKIFLGMTVNLGWGLLLLVFGLLMLLSAKIAAGAEKAAKTKEK
jgi:protein-S-isoprenylcysteine O-methyltransferase Ste14